MGACAICGQDEMTKQKTPHTQSQQNVAPEQTDLEPDEQESDVDTSIYEQMEGAQTGQNRAPERVQTRSRRKTGIAPAAAQEGSITTRTPKRPVQGITSRSAEEESERQEKVVNDRPDAQAGVNHSK
jgi:hypothetical protein